MEPVTKKKASPVRLVLILVVIAALIAGGIFGFCAIQDSNAKKALAENDFDTAIACYERNFLSGDEKILEARMSQGHFYIDQQQYQEAADIFEALGAQAERTEALLLQGKQLTADRKYDEAMELLASLGEAGADAWQEAAVKQIEARMIQGKFDDAEALVVKLTDAELAAEFTSKLNLKKFQKANKNYRNGDYMPIEEFEQYPMMKELIATITDRDFLKDWDYNDFNARYAADCILEKDFETAIEFFNYCDSKYDRPYAEIIQLLLDKDLDGAMAILETMEYTNLKYDLDMSWPEIFAFVSGVEKNENDLNSLLTFQNIQLRLNQGEKYTFEAWAQEHGEYSSNSTPKYVGPVEKSQYSFPVEDLDALYEQCGTNPQGKVLILRSQKNYPRDGKTYYAVELWRMEYLYADLYPADLSEVEYIIMVDYDFSNAGKYKRTFTMGDKSTEDVFDFLRFKGRVTLIQLSDSKKLFTSPWVNGTGEADVFGAEVWQGSNLPDVGKHMVTAVEKLR